jgi:two-component system, OmpR family, phosphate regulon response regulator PhoB
LEHLACRRTMPPKRILICDDEAPTRELVRVVLEDGEAYEFLEAADGLRCLALARSMKPDLVVLDVMLPGKGGLEVLAAIRRDPDLAGAPVVVVTAWDHLAAEASAAGADRFLLKPFEPERLREAAAELLAGR